MAIATVFLTVLAIIGGLLLSQRHRRLVHVSAPVPSAVQTTPPVLLSGPLCPSETRKTAGELGFPRDLRQIFRIVTDKGNVVWICADSNQNLYYQGKTGGEHAPLVQGVNGLFLNQVIMGGPADFQVIAPNDYNRIEVTATQLIIHRTGEHDQVQTVVSN